MEEAARPGTVLSINQAEGGIAMRDPISMIPLSSLKASKRNIRKTDRTADIDALAESIQAHGLLQNLTVRTYGSADSETYEVIAGGRRLAALKKLSKHKAITPDFPVPCRVLADEDASDTELSLAENELRVPIHPADQFEAFSKLQADGLGAEEIAARFGVAPSVVARRLKLAAVSPKLIQAYREEELTLDHLMAFAITDDHEAQERIWFEDADRHPSPYVIRQALTAAHVRAGDRRARFIGADAYEAAGGEVVRDLFHADDEGYFTDVALLDRLASEKLAEAVKRVAAEGWQWVETMLVLDYEYLGRFGRRSPTIEPRTDEEEQKLSELGERYDALVADLDEEPSFEALEEIDKVEAEINRLSVPKEIWDDEVCSQCGALVSLDPSGEVLIVRGLTKPDGKAPAGEKRKRNSEKKRGIPDGLRETLSAHRTTALRIELSRNPELAFRALVHTLALGAFYAGGDRAVVDVRAIPAELGTKADGIGESLAVRAYAEQHEAVARILPKEPEALWSWLGEQSLEANLELLAHCVGGAVNALWRRNDQGQDGRLAMADRLATDIGLDMARWWCATRVSFFDHVTKDTILEAISEGASKQAANNVVSLKKGAIAARAEKLLENTQWLPEPLRTKLAS